MPRVKISKTAAQKVKRLSEETYEELSENTGKLRKDIEDLFKSLNDPAATKTFDVMYEELMSFLRNAGSSFSEIEKYCDDTIRWVDEHNESWR